MYMQCSPVKTFPEHCNTVDNISLLFDYKLLLTSSHTIPTVHVHVSQQQFLAAYFIKNKLFTCTCT